MVDSEISGLCPLRTSTAPSGSSRTYGFLSIWLCWVLATVCRIFSCGMRTELQDLVPYQWSNLGSLHWELKLLATGPLGSSSYGYLETSLRTAYLLTGLAHKHTYLLFKSVSLEKRSPKPDFPCSIPQVLGWEQIHRAWHTAASRANVPSGGGGGLGAQSCPTLFEFMDCSPRGSPLSMRFSS